MQRYSMSRGIMVLDESVANLDTFLSNWHFRVRPIPPGMADEDIMINMLAKRIFITKNPNDFVDFAVGMEFGIIGITDAAMANPASVAKTISQMFSSYALQNIIPFKAVITPHSTKVWSLSATGQPTLQHPRKK